MVLDESWVYYTKKKKEKKKKKDDFPYLPPKSIRDQISIVRQGHLGPYLEPVDHFIDHTGRIVLKKGSGHSP